MATQKELLAAQRLEVDSQWRERWPEGQWTFIHGGGSFWVAHQVRRATSRTRPRARHGFLYTHEGGKGFAGDDIALYPSRWYGKPCRVEHHRNKTELLARLDRAGVPAVVIDAVKGWD
jgi:hypothetical protein